jgi:hypothetical protein
VINANQGDSLTINSGTTTTNTAALEATGGGTLNLVGAYTHAGGKILSTGTSGGSPSPSKVNLNGSVISGGTMTTSGGGVIKNNGSATLNGVSISFGSTLTLLDTTTLQGTITNNGTVAESSGGDNTDVQLSGAVTLNGTGSLTMSNRFRNRVYGSGAGSTTLTIGAGHTIQGTGQFDLGSGAVAFAFTNNGTVLANQSVALTINPGNGTTNNGTFQANSGSILVVQGSLTNYNATTSALTGGTYNAFFGTIELTEANAHGAPPAVIATNAATILLDGATAKIADGSGNDIIRTFLSSNTATGGFTIQNGANLTTAATG